MSKFAMLGYVIVFLLAFALFSVAIGFFKAAFQQRKADKAAAEEKQGEKKKIKRLDE